MQANADKETMKKNEPAMSILSYIYSQIPSGHSQDTATESEPTPIAVHLLDLRLLVVFVKQGEDIVR